LFKWVEQDIPSLWNLTFEDRHLEYDLVVSITKHMASLRLMIDGFIRNQKKEGKWLRSVVAELEDVVVYRGVVYADTRTKPFDNPLELRLIMAEEKFRRMILFQKFDHVLM
jgi:hypothetical protein